MALAGLNIELNADIVKFQNAIEKAAYLAEKSGKEMEAAFQSANAHVKLLEAGIKGLGTSLGALGVIGGIGAFVGMIKGSIETAAEFKRLSESTGVSVSALSAMSATAKLVGMDMNAVGLMVSKLDNVMWKAQGGNKAAEQSFKKIGVAAMDSSGHLRNSEDVMLDVAKKMESMESGAARTGLAIELFGKKGAQMIPFLLELAEKGDLSGRVTDKQAESAQRLEIAWVKFQRSMNGWKFSAMEAIAPALERIVPLFPYLAGGAISFIGVVKLLPMAINGVTTSVKLLNSMMLISGTTGTGVFAGLTTACNTFSAAIAANPLGAIAVAITASIAALYVFQDKLLTIGNTTASLGNWLGAIWDAIKDVAVAIWDSIGSKVMAVYEGLKTIVTAYVDATIWLWSKIFDGIKFYFQSIYSIGKWVYDNLGSWAQSAVRFMVAPFVKAYEFFVKLKNAIVNSAGDISQRAAVRQAKDDSESKPKGLNKISPVNTGDGKTTKIDPFAKAMSEMGAQKSALEWGVDHWKEYKGGIDSSKEAMARFEVEMGKFSDLERKREGRSALTGSEKQKYIDAGKALDDLTQKKKSYDDLIKFNNDTTKQAADRQAMIKASEDEAKLRGLGTLEASNLKIEIQEQLKLQERVNSLLKDTALNERDRADAISKATEESKKYTAAAKDVNTTKYMGDRSFTTGMNEGLNSITENATNSAAQIKSVMTGAFNGASDALANFCKTGKFNFQSFAMSMIDMLIKIAAQKALAGLVGSIAGAFTGAASSAAAGTIGQSVGSPAAGTYNLGSGSYGLGFRASGGGVDSGSPYIVGESGPELVIPNSKGTVIPNHQVRQAISGVSSNGGGNNFNGDVNVVVNSNGQSSSTGGAGTMSDLGAQIGSIVQQHLMTQMRPGGLLAA